MKRTSPPGAVSRVSSPRRLRLALTVAGSAALVWACGEDAGSNGGTSSLSPAEGAQNGSMPGAVESSTGMPAAPAPFQHRPLAKTASETRLTRLTHTQYLHTVQDLFGIKDSLDLTFAPDALNGFAFDTSNDFRVDARLGPQYRAMAETLASRAVTEAAIFSHIVPCDAASAGCSDQFLRTFGERVFRRPLLDEELTSFQQLFGAAAGLVQSGDAFRDGVRLTLEAMFQSPQFLYRADAGQQTGAAGEFAALSPRSSHARRPPRR